MEFYIARCQACDIKVPFGDEHERDRWAIEHSQAPHTKALAPVPAGVVRGGAVVTTWMEQF